MSKLLVTAAVFLATAPLNAQNLGEYERTSIINLVSTPERFHQKKVVVVGWMTLKFEDMSLCLAERVPSAKECVWLNIPGSDDRQRKMLKDWARHTGQVVIVNGVFDKDELGHFGAWAGGVRDIVRIVPRDSKP
jgi:hypothetical protein